MSETWQIIVVALLVVGVTLLGMFLSLQIRRDRLLAEASLRSAENYRMMFTPERSHLDNSVKELHARYARTQQQIDELGELLKLSLRASDSVPEPKNSMSNSVDLANRSAFLQGLGLSFDASRVRSDRVFVLTPFVPSEEGNFDAIRRACGRVGLSAFRASEEFAGGNILNSIIYSIVYSRFVVANLTGRNANVFYEAAIAQMLEKRVVLISHARDPLPFDVNQQSIIPFHDGNELEYRLTEAIARYGVSEGINS